MGPVHYKNKRVRFYTVIIASFYMLIHGTKFDIYRAITSPGFYLVWGISFMVTLLLVEYVHYITKRLDINYGWRSKTKERAVAQLLFGLILPAVADLLILSVYFGFLGQNIFDNRYFHIDFPVVLFLLILLNGYYFVQYWLLTDPRHVEKHVEMALATHDTDQVNAEETFTIQSKGVCLHIEIRSILYFYRNGKQVDLVTVFNEKLSTSENLKILEERFLRHGFIRINRSVVFNFNEVLGYEAGERRNTLKLVLDPKYDEHLYQHKSDGFFVTNEHLSDVLRRFA